MISTTNSTESCLSPTTGAAPLLFASAINFFAASQCLMPPHWPPNANVNDGEVFDFIIVGGGSAGCVVARRLSEVKRWKILLLEAGPDPPIEATIPITSSEAFHTKYDWNYHTINNKKTSQGLENGNVYWPRAKMLGGCSEINAMVYIRGNDNDYQAWVEQGNPEWQPNIVKKYFKKAESLQDYKLGQTPEIRNFYGKNGPLVINTFNNTRRALDNKVLSAWNEIGFKNVLDLNVANVQGSGIMRVTAFDGRRGGTAQTYLIPVQNRSNLKIVKNAFVTKILINGKSHVYGVEVEINDKTVNFYASHEVILSAGTINTPQLLMLSGVGAKQELEENHVPLKVLLPAVGKNLQDHPIINIIVAGNEPNSETDDTKKYLDAILYLYNRTGPFAENGLADIVSFYSSKKDARAPEFQNHLIIFDKKSPHTADFYKTYFQYNNETIDSIVNVNKNKSIYSFGVILLHPLSRGSITLKSNNPHDYPLIEPNYFGDLKDLNTTHNGIKILTAILNTTFFKSINAFIPEIYYPQCKMKFKSDNYWRCVVKNYVGSIFHPVGTCKMGPDPQNNVVDSRLRVHKVRKLRIIDASIMPLTISGNINGPVIMIAERGADMIKEDYNLL